MRSFFLAVASLVSMSVAVGCAAQADSETLESSQSSIAPNDTASADVGDDGEQEDTALVAADDSKPASLGDIAVLAGVGEAKTTHAVNLRASGAADAAVISIVPEGMIVNIVTSKVTDGFYNVDWNGVSGYVSASFLTPEGSLSTLETESETDDAEIDLEGSPSPANAIARSKAAMGFSYYWGGGAWLASGPTSSTKGSCTGACPSCTHRGSYGADCSGLVAKAWQFGTKKLSVNSHPYGTTHFNRDVAGKWKTISRASMKAGDALVYNTNGKGHIVVYEKGDVWGKPTVYECRGCSYGCVHNARSFNSSYHAIRRAGF